MQTNAERRLKRKLLKPGDETNLTREEYKSFLEKLVKAETTAKREKLGIWSESN